MNIQGDGETCHPASRSRTDKSRNTVTRNWVFHCYAQGIWRIAQKAKINKVSRAIQLHVTGSSHSTEPNRHVLKYKQCAAFRTFMRLLSALKQDLNASAHTERLLPCSSANLVSFCWLLFHVWPDPNSFQIYCFLSCSFHIKSTSIHATHTSLPHFCSLRFGVWQVDLITISILDQW